MPKLGDLKSVAHNLAASVADGVSFLYGTYSLDIFGEATAAPGGRIVVDFLTGKVIEGDVSPELKKTLAESPTVLATLGLRHAVLPSDFKVLNGSFGVDQVYGSHFTVDVEDNSGRRWKESYSGSTGHRLIRGHKAPTRS